MANDIQERGTERAKHDGDGGVRHGLRACVVSQRAALVRLLETRGLELSPGARDRIAACVDLTALDAWLLRAIGAREEADIFG